MQKHPRILAFYLPQFHPIPENDEWWGKGFTEWTNVAKAKPLYKGHQQPNIPADLGFYDLRVPETRELQAKLAKEHGIEGFLYWHYWFAGKKLLEKPFEDVLKTGKPDFPFCLGWANESWTGIWHGLENKTLIKQTYPGKDDYKSHFNYLLSAFKDPRYIKIDDMPLFYVLKPHKIPNYNDFIVFWNELALKNGLKGIYFIAPSGYPDKEAEFLFSKGYNGIHSFRFEEAFSKLKKRSITSRIKRKILRIFKLTKKVQLRIYDYSQLVQNFITDEDKNASFYPTIYPGWDNSPRSGPRALILENSNPERFQKHIRQVLETVKDKPKDKRIIFLKSWNEWAEGNYMEPDLKFGMKYLRTLKEEINRL